MEVNMSSPVLAAAVVLEAVARRAALAVNLPRFAIIPPVGKAGGC